MTVTSARKDIEDHLATVLTEILKPERVRVYRGEHIARDPNEWRTLFVARTRGGREYIHGWEFFRSGRTDNRGPGVPIDQVRLTHTYTIRGYYGYNTRDSEAEFQAVVDRVMDKLSETVRINSSLRTLAPAATLAKDMMANEMVHVCEILYPVEEQVSRS